MFYRSGWLRCVGLKYVFRADVTYGIYYILLLYYYIILFSCSIPFLPIQPSSHIPLIFFLKSSSNNHSISFYTCREFKIHIYIIRFIWLGFLFWGYVYLGVLFRAGVIYFILYLILYSFFFCPSSDPLPVQYSMFSIS